MEDPGKLEKTIAGWLQELTTFPSTWFRIARHPIVFLRGITAWAAGRAEPGITEPILFWFLNTLGALMIVACADRALVGMSRSQWGVVLENLRLPLLKAAIGTGVFWLIVAARFRSWNQKWLVAKILCYASVSYLPLSLLTSWVGEKACWQAFMVFRAYFAGTSSPPFPWPLGVGMIGVVLFAMLWLTFIAKGLTMIDGKPKRPVLAFSCRSCIRGGRCCICRWILPGA